MITVITLAAALHYYYFLRATESDVIGTVTLQFIDSLLPFNAMSDVCFKTLTN